MASGFESAGDAALGALTARVVEPRAGEHSHTATSPQCLNCGTRLTGQFCHSCGQDGHVHRTLGAIGHDLAHGVLHLEGKTWRTLPMLASRPGDLTRRYIAGERARFVSPLAMFLFSVFLMFAILAQLPGMDFDSDLLKPGAFQGMAQVRTRLADEKAKAAADIAKWQRQLAEARVETADDSARIARLEARVAEAIQGRDAIAAAERNLTVQRTRATELARRVERANPAESWFGARVRHVQENPQLLIYKLKTSAYKYSWALIPISLPFIWLLFPLRRDVGFYDHSVFATYSLAFMSLLVIALAVLVALGLDSGIAWLAAMIIVPVHLYKQLKYAYRLSRAGALWRTLLMVGFAFFALIVFAAMLLGMGIAG